MAGDCFADAGDRRRPGKSAYPTQLARSGWNSRGRFRPMRVRRQSRFVGPELPASVQAGGLRAVSRWLSEATPPDKVRHPSGIPEGCQPRPIDPLGLAGTRRPGWLNSRRAPFPPGANETRTCGGLRSQRETGSSTKGLADECRPKFWSNSTASAEGLRRSSRYFRTFGWAGLGIRSVKKGQSRSAM